MVIIIKLTEVALRKELHNPIFLEKYKCVLKLSDKKQNISGFIVQKLTIVKERVKEV